MTDQYFEKFFDEAEKAAREKVDVTHYDTGFDAATDYALTFLDGLKHAFLGKGIEARILFQNDDRPLVVYERAETGAFYPVYEVRVSLADPMIEFVTNSFSHFDNTANQTYVCIDSDQSPFLSPHDRDKLKDVFCRIARGIKDDMPTSNRHSFFTRVGNWARRNFGFGLGANG